MRNSNQGFSLLELMIAVTIVGLLAAIAYPFYQDSVRASRRAEAQGALIALGNAMERVFTQRNSYQIGGSAPGLGSGATDIFPSQAPLDGPRKFYDLSISAPTATSYTVRAQPIAGTSQAVDGMLELDHTGAKRWDEDNNGSFGSSENSWN